MRFRAGQYIYRRWPRSTRPLSRFTIALRETDRLIGSYKPAAIHGAFASALTLIASEVAERAKVPLLTGSSSDQLNQGRQYTFTPFARASQFARAQLQMAKLVMTTLKIVTIPEAVTIPLFSQAIDAQGLFVGNEGHEKAARVMLDELLRWSNALRVLRSPA